MENNKLTTKQILLIILLILLILLGIFGALCGGYFSIVGLNDKYFGPLIFLPISLPSLLFGLLFIFLGYKGIKKVKNNNPN